MGWKEDADRRVKAFPDEILRAHKHSTNHRAEIIRSHHCGCFHCCAIFVPGQVTTWIDDVNGEGQTALCPSCGIDSLVGDASGFGISRDFLDSMKSYWFWTVDVCTDYDSPPNHAQQPTGSGVPWSPAG